MTHIVVAAHGDLASGLVMAAEMIAGEQPDLTAVALQPGESPESFGATLAAVLAPLGDEDLLILIDLFGGTPYNVAARQVLKPHVECVTGVNLPMLLEVLMSRDGIGVRELASIAENAGRESAKNLRPMLVR
jgi:mannose/fructose/sorbose-specific phosphotransferase system IIA component